MRIRHVIGLVAALVLGGQATADIGTAFTFQGRLNQGGQAYNGNADVTFRLFDAPNGGVQVGSTLEAPATPVSQGAFTVDLDFGAGVFDGNPRWLEIEVNGVVLAPRQPILPTPYALYTTTGPGLGGGGASWEFRGDEITTNDTVDIVNDGQDDFALYVSSDYAAGSTGFIQNTGTGIGLSVRANYALEGVSLADSGATYGVFGLTHSPDGKAGWFSAPFDGHAGYFEGRSYFGGNVGIGTENPLRKLHVHGSGDEAVAIWGNGSVPLLHFRNNTNAADWILKHDDSKFHVQKEAVGSEILTLQTNGNVGIGTTEPGMRLDVRGGSTGAAAQMRIGNANADTWVELWSGHSGGDNDPAIIWSDEAAADDLRFGTGNASGSGFFELVRIKGNGNVGIGTSAPTGRLHVIDISGQPALKVQGIAQVTVLEITGADLAEKFPVSEETAPGTVMAIDPETPGSLCVARGAYNRCVAGVVSGANDLSVGAVLGNLPGHEDAPPIALSGRVWVQCDAASAPIRPGDLLTTSKTPGHAMVASDHERAQGAIIGKAMTPLEQGTGLVLVLVSLQ